MMNIDERFGRGGLLQLLDWPPQPERPVAIAFLLCGGLKNPPFKVLPRSNVPLQ